MSLKIGIIGAGRVGCALALGMKSKGYTIAGICSRNTATLEFLRESLKYEFATEIPEVVGEADTIFITVPDSYIEETAQKIAYKAGQEGISGKTFFHCSGSLTSEVLKPLILNGGYAASMHPVQTFADFNNGWKGLDGIYFGFEGCKEAEGIAKSISNDFNGRLLIMKLEAKPLYHAAACIISNYVAALAQISSELLNEIGLEPDEAYKVFAPLLKNTADNIAKLGPVQALTGPIARGDAGVVEKHLEAMAAMDAGYSQIYKTLGRATVGLALVKGTISKDIAERLYQIMEC